MRTEKKKKKKNQTSNITKPEYTVTHDAVMLHEQQESMGSRTGESMLKNLHLSKCSTVFFAGGRGGVSQSQAALLPSSCTKG